VSVRALMALGSVIDFHHSIRHAVMKTCLSNMAAVKDGKIAIAVEETLDQDLLDYETSDVVSEPSRKGGLA
jgi:hypothetical protein